MASSYFFSSLTIRYKSSIAKTRHFDLCQPLCSSVALTKTEPVVRRSANYEPSLWSFDHIQSLASKYAGEDYVTRADTLKETVKTMIHKYSKVGNPVETLQLVDDLQRLGISYHFETEIRDVLQMIYQNYYKSNDKRNIMDLNLKSLGFRLLRQHGFHVPQELFHNFKDTTKDLKPHIYKDMVAILNLYEASYHSFENESILDDARDFTTKYLHENRENIDESLSSLVSHALELPLHWRVGRVEAHWFIKEYEKRSGVNLALIELAKLDFDMVQAIYLEDLKDSSRWDINAIEELPDYMQMCFLGFYNSINEIAYNTLTSTGLLIVPYLKKAWSDLCKAYLVEAKWYHNGYTPTLEQYLDNACVSISAHVTLTHYTFLIANTSSKEILEWLERADDIVRYSSLILRLADDLGTSSDEMARGDNPKSIQCYMHEN